MLFICSRNQWRSPTAEQVFRRHPALAVRSAGTSASARRRVGAADLAWADVVFVMEGKHRSRLMQDHSELLAGKPLHVLDIPDDYRFMDPELVDLLQTLPPLGESALPLHLDTLEVWPNGVAALCPQVIPEPLHRLHQDLGRCLDALDLPRESRAYRPHVTLARKAHGLTATSRPAVPWQAHSYVLALSDRGYHVLHRWG